MVSKHDNGFRAPEVVAQMEAEDPTDPSCLCVDWCRCVDQATSRTEVRREATNAWAPPEHELNRAITAIDQQYDVEDLGYAGDARLINVRDKVTGSYIMTISMVRTQR